MTGEFFLGNGFILIGIYKTLDSRSQQRVATENYSYVSFLISFGKIAQCLLLFSVEKIPQFLTERYDYASSCINSVLHAKPLSRCLEAANYN